MKREGQGSNQHPYNTTPQPQITKKNVIFMDHQKKGPPNSTCPKIAETTPTVALTRVLLSQGRP